MQSFPRFAGIATRERSPLTYLLTVTTGYHGQYSTLIGKFGVMIQLEKRNMLVIAKRSTGTVHVDLGTWITLVPIPQIAVFGCLGFLLYFSVPSASLPRLGFLWTAHYSDKKSFDQFFGRGYPKHVHRPFPVLGSSCTCIRDSDSLKSTLSRHRNGAHSGHDHVLRRDRERMKNELVHSDISDRENEPREKRENHEAKGG